jgi:hypothetical protein
MKENDYLPPKLAAIVVAHQSYVCASMNVDFSTSNEDFKVDIVDY